MKPHEPRRSEDKVRETYRRRDASGKRRLYRGDRGETVAWMRRRGEVASQGLRQAGLGDRLQDIRVLDVGCGTGAWLQELATWGCRPGYTMGVELLATRLQEGKAAHPDLGLVMASGWSLPVCDGAFDLVTLFTVLSSLPDAEDRRALGREIRRVARPGAHVLVYDFRIRRPGSTDLVGIGPRAVEKALDAPVIWRRSLTLAPPLARILGRFGAGGVVVAERLLPIFRTHRMYLVRLP